MRLSRPAALAPGRLKRSARAGVDPWGLSAQQITKLVQLPFRLEPDARYGPWRSSRKRASANGRKERAVSGGRGKAGIPLDMLVSTRQPPRAGELIASQPQLPLERQPGGDQFLGDLLRAKRRKSVVGVGVRTDCAAVCCNLPAIVPRQVPSVRSFHGWFRRNPCWHDKERTRDPILVKESEAISKGVVFSVIEGDAEVASVDFIAAFEQVDRLRRRDEVAKVAQIAKLPGKRIARIGPDTMIHDAKDAVV